jgi:periplasmic protein TonB
MTGHAARGTVMGNTPQRRNRRRHLPLIIVGGCVATVGMGAFALVRSFVVSGAGPTKPVVQQIQLIRPPPPPPEAPPPPPPPEEKVVANDPPPNPDPKPSNDPPPSPNLGLDTEGGAGGDAFGLVGNKGGRDITAGGGGSAFAWYAGLMKDQILDLLNEDKNVRSGSYRVSLRAVIRADGTVDRLEIVKGSGDRARDRAIETDLGHLKRVPQARPSGMPDVVNFEIVSRG